MGATTVTRHAPALTEKELRSWYEGELADMARESGTGAYSGNWNANQGFSILPNAVKTDEEGMKLLDARADKWGPVYALRVGDFTKAFPETKGEKALVEKLEELRLNADEFDWHVLDRAQKAKSKTRKCTTCESGINVHKMEKPSLAEFRKAERGHWDWPHVFWMRGSRYMPLLRSLTDCPVCGANLLKTDTDKKNQVSLTTRLNEASKKVDAARVAHKAKHAGKPQPHWLVHALCGC